jgi:two-component system NtrC family response regulator
MLNTLHHPPEPRLECAKAPPDLAPGFENLLGVSPPMHRVFDALRKVATSVAPVLLLGETGTGKELAAQAIHARSPRRDGPFVVINCTAIPAALAESELFGHERGAFTGAHRQRRGRIEAATGGTLFLDEIGELSPLLQTRLLRFLQEQTIERVGGREPIRVDARVISATHVNLDRALRENRFREDLYYRLAVVSLRLPPLRERQGDLPALAQEFLRRASFRAGKAGLSFSPRALRALENHRWPGNVRELENRVERAVIMADAQCLEPEDLELSDGVAAPSDLSLKQARAAVEREAVERALRRHVGKIAPAAAELRVSRPTFYDLMNRLGIPRDRKLPREPRNSRAGER